MHPHMTYNSLHIFTDDCLRLDDNPALLNSLKTTHKLYTVFYYGHILKISPPPVHRILFLLDSLKGLHARLDQFGVPLYLIDTPMSVSLRNLIAKWKINRVTTEAANSIVGRKNQKSLEYFLAGFGVKFVTENSTTLYDIRKLPGNIKETEFFKLISKMQPKSPILEDLTLELSKFSSSADLEVNRTVPDPKDFGLTDKVLEKVDRKFFGGEVEAMAQLEKLLMIRCDQETPQNKMELLCDPIALSPAIKFGCISVHTIYTRVSKVKSDHPEVVNRIYDGLKRRDFYILIGGQCANIDNQGSIYTYVLPWDEKAEHQQRFHSGQTGYPIVDAAVAQLKAEGFVHSSIKSVLVKMVTCDLMWLGWQEGVKMFYRWSIDYNSAICGLSWMYGAKSTWLFETMKTSDAPSFDGLNELDPEGEYVKKYLPELTRYPKEYIHTPWRAPLDLQTKMNCVIGLDYPVPLFCDLEARFKLCRERLDVFYNLITKVRRHQAINQLSKRYSNSNNSNNSNNNNNNNTQDFISKIKCTK
ncbi:cryptochrome [Oopsacas minuta]|uniref:Cryptochrome n=1 Tax=Oopsacas minuta TaxID=111878 RepID=A0AAV7JJJ9_9METZ|nr:cryptochrome [Oopsacas minuta]